MATRTAIGAGWIIAWRVVTRNIGLVSTLILVRLLKPEDFGLVALATGFINAVDSLSSIGVQDALVRLSRTSRDLYNTGFALSVLRAVLTSLLIVALAFPLGRFFDEPRLGVVMLALALGTLISGFENIGIVDFRRELAFHKEFDLQVWPRLIGVAVTVGSAAIWQSYWCLIAGIVAFRLARLIRSYMISSYRPGFTLCAWRDIIGFSLWTWAQTLLYQARDRSDSIVIGRVMGATQVGVFSVGQEVGLLPISELVEPLSRALFPGFAAVQHTRRHVNSLFLGAIGVGFLVILPAAIGISMVADPMVRITLGANWISAIPVVQILAASGATAIFSYASGMMLNALGWPHITFYLGCISTAARIVLLIILVPTVGLTGAAIALAVAMSIDLVTSMAVALYLTKLSIISVMRACYRPIIACLAMVLMMLESHYAWTASSAQNTLGLWTELVQRCGLGAVCYVGVLLALWLARGRPEGPEQQLLNIILRFKARLSRRKTPSPAS